MDPLVDRAERAARRHTAAALPLRELAHLIQESGARVPDDVLLRALTAHPGRFRVIDPWKGPWSRLRADRRTGALTRARGGGHPGPDLVDGPRVVPRVGTSRWSPGAAAPLLGRMRRTLIRVGWSVDDDSPADLTRWHRLVLEGNRVRGRLTGRT